MMNMQNMMRASTKNFKTNGTKPSKDSLPWNLLENQLRTLSSNFDWRQKVVSVTSSQSCKIQKISRETLSDMTVQAVSTALEQIDETTKKKLGLSLENCLSNPQKRNRCFSFFLEIKNSIAFFKSNSVYSDRLEPL